MLGTLLMLLRRHACTLAMVALAAIAFTSAWKVQGFRYEARLAALQAAQAQALAAAHAQTRAIEQNRIREIEHVRRTAQIQIDALQADVSRADGLAGRLRRELASVRASARTAPIDTTAAERGQSQPDTSSTDLLSGMLERVERDGRAIARYADELRVAALTCAAGYDGVGIQRKDSNHER